MTTEASSSSTLHGTLSGEAGRPRAELLLVGLIFLAARLLLGVAGFPLAGPAATVAALVTIAAFADRGLSMPLGLHRPDSWLQALFWGVVALAGTVIVGLIVLPHLLFALPESASVPDHFGYLRDNPFALALTLVLVGWLAAAFGEEVLWRGFVMPRLAATFGDSLAAWIAAILAQALLFGVLHAGAVGQITAGLLGLVYGLVYWLGGRNLWPLIIVHAIPETISLIGEY